jgi:hypothetical protein
VSLPTQERGTTALAMAGVSADELVRLPVRLRGIQLGWAVDLILDRGRRRGVGLEVRCGDGERRFLPLPVATIEASELRIASPLGLLEEAQLRFYTERGSTFRALRGLGVVRNGAALGSLDDLELESDGTIVAVIVLSREGRQRIEYTQGIELGAVRAAS